MMAVMKEDYCIELLKNELAVRKSKNPSYSLRAFARNLGIGSTSLSDALANKRKLSKTNLERIVEKLNLSPAQKEMLFLEHSQGKKVERPPHLEVNEDMFRLIADWYYLGILSLARTKGAKFEVNWVARRLGIEKLQAEVALTRLERLKLIENRRGCLRRTSEPISTTREIASKAIRKHHMDNLELARTSLEDEKVESREFSSVTMAINPKNLKKAKDYLMKVKDRVCEILEQGELKEVYTLSFKLFPLTDVKREKEK